MRKKATKKQWDYFKTWLKWRVKDPEAIDAHDNVLKAIIDIVATETNRSKSQLSEIPWMEYDEFSGMVSVGEAVKYLRQMIEDMNDEDDEEQLHRLWYGQLGEMDRAFLRNYFLDEFVGD